MKMHGFDTVLSSRHAGLPGSTAERPMNWAQGRYVASRGQRFGDGDDNVIFRGRDGLLRIVVGLVEADDTVSGGTVVTAGGRVEHADVGTLRRGGRT